MGCRETQATKLGARFVKTGTHRLPIRTVGLGRSAGFTVRSRSDRLVWGAPTPVTVLRRSSLGVTHECTKDTNPVKKLLGGLSAAILAVGLVAASPLAGDA